MDLFKPVALVMSLVHHHRRRSLWLVPTRRHVEELMRLAWYGTRWGVA